MYTPSLGPRIQPPADLRDINDKGLVPLWFAQMTPQKLNFGIPYYGRGYTAQDKNCVHTECKFSGGNKATECYDTAGFISNNQICDLISKKGLKPELTHKGVAQKQIS
jgi:chitinase